MVITRQCSRCRKEEGDSDPEGNEITFTGSYKRCDRCTGTNEYKNSKKNDYARMKYPTPHNICVYAFKEGKEVSYIGSSDNTSYRIWEHYNQKSKTSKSFCKKLNPLQRQMKFTWHILWYGDSMEDAFHVEKLMIQSHQPKFNKLKYDNYEG